MATLRRLPESETKGDGARGEEPVPDINNSPKRSERRGAVIVP